MPDGRTGGVPLSRRRALLRVVLLLLGCLAVLRLAGGERGTLTVFLVGLLPLVLLPAWPALLVGLLRRDRVVAASAAALVAAHVLVVLPALTSVPLSAAARSAPRLRVGVANLYVLNREPEATGRALRSLDLDVLVVPELAAAGVAGLRASGLLADLPHQVRVADGGAETVGLLSRLPLTDVTTRQGDARVLPRATVQVGGVALRVLAGHPLPPLWVLEPAWRSSLRELADESAAVEGPLVVLGDLNGDRDQGPSAGCSTPGCATRPTSGAGGSPAPGRPPRRCCSSTTSSSGTAGGPGWRSWTCGRSGCPGPTTARSWPTSPSRRRPPGRAGDRPVTAPGVHAVERALGLLELLARAGGRLGLSELAERSGLPLGTVHRLLATLVATGAVRQEADRRYALGPALIPIGDAATRLLGDWAQPFLVRLVEASGETANLAVLDDDHVLYLAQAPGRHRMRMFTEVGRRVAPHTTAVGKVLLAWRDEAQVRRTLSRSDLAPRTAHSITSVRGFLDELARVRRQGWAVDDEEEEEGVRCLAVPVGPGASAVAAVSVSGPAVRLQHGDPAVLRALHDVAADLADRLGASAVELSALRK